MSRITLRPVVAALALTLAAGAYAASAGAATTDTPAATPCGSATAPHHKGKGQAGHRFHHGQAMRDALWIPGIGPVGKQEVARLQLDTKQQALFDAARQARRDMHKSIRESAMNRHKALDTQLQAGKLDPRALADAQGQSHQQVQQQSEQVQQKWLAVWDSLNDGQRQQVTQFLKDRKARWEARREHGKGGHRPHGHPVPTSQPAPSTAS